MNREQIQKIVDEWEESGAIKTSLFYRLQSALFNPSKRARETEPALEGGDGSEANRARVRS